MLNQLLNRIPTVALQGLLDMMASRGAIIAYVVILLVILAVLVIFVMNNDLKGASAQPTVVIQKGIPNANSSASAPLNQGASTPEGEEGDEGAGRAPRFCMLSRIDENKGIYEQKEFDSDVSLQRFCESFRNYAASELKLYYDIKDIRRFVAGLAVSPIIILQGDRKSVV